MSADFAHDPPAPDRDDADDRRHRDRLEAEGVPRGGLSAAERWRIAGSFCAAILALAVVVGIAVMRNHAAFAAYRSATLFDPDHPPIWSREPVEVEGCVDVAVGWALECPGVQSWCEAEIPVVTRACLESQDRARYCAQVGDEIMSTRFGYRACEAQRDRIDGKYRKRAHKKYCALAYRAVAGHCLAGTATGAPRAEGPTRRSTGPASDP